jgi:hypothetical protein
LSISGDVIFNISVIYLFQVIKSKCNQIGKCQYLNMRQAQHVWRTKSYNFKREAWEGNAIFFSSNFVIFFLNYLAGVISLWLFKWRLKVCLFAKKKSYKIFRSFKRSYIDRNILYYNKNKIQIQMFVLFPNIFETKQYVTYLSNRFWCHIFYYSHTKTTRKYRK